MTELQHGTPDLADEYDHQLLDTDPLADPDCYPTMRTISPGFMAKAVIEADDPQAPEYVTVPMNRDRGELWLRTANCVAQWNMFWESAQYRRLYFQEDELPPRLQALADLGENNLMLVPRTKSRFYEYSLHLHLLPKATLQRHGIPLLRGGTWPYLAQNIYVDQCLPVDFEARLSRAWADTVWRDLVSGSPMRGFSTNEPIRLLAHNLDYWTPAMTAAATEIVTGWPRSDRKTAPGPVPLSDGTFLDGAKLVSPRQGGILWCGEEEASQVRRRAVELADSTGKLRAILDAIRSHRVQDDFSDVWSYAKEDFERKLYRKRAKVKVTFVELTDNIPVQGPETEVVGNTVLSDFMALLDPESHRIVVLLQSGTTNLTQIAETMGYANHSAISKRLAKIRRLAKQHLGPS
ncbi:hypothetical protein [Actinokineospora inagensis]|uniref:hypothetical protein n=1 Tax=Actinokineospora inagensis TaxID=103730 RepID=UPI00041EDC62|nr:hypothetical protein [Actinokineospora inagensis]